VTETAVRTVAPRAMPPAGPVLLVGAGLLHGAIAAILHGRCRTVAPDAITDDTVADAVAATVLVAVTDADDPRGHHRLHRVAVERGTPFLPVRVERDRVLMGPSAHPGKPGCPTCAMRRRRGNRDDAPARAALLREHGPALAGTPSPLVTPVVARAVAGLVADEIEHLACARDAGRTRHALVSVSTRTAAVHRNRVLPDPLCPDCARLPADDPTAALVVARPLPKPGPSQLRLVDLTSRAGQLRELYVDAETGVIASIGNDTRAGIPVAVARLEPASDADDSRHGFGRTDSFRAADTTALAEALERLAMFRPRGRRTTVWAAYADVADRAVDPRTLGLYPDSWYDRPDFPFARFDPAAPLRWVWGYSFGRGAPVLVPESYVYLGVATAEEPALAFECSNGYALGSTLEEAILHGLLEVAERDAFLMTWYARLPVPQVDLRSARDRRIPLLAELVRQRLGYEVMVFATAVEQRVPAFWTMAVDRVGGAGRPALMCAAAAHPDPERALRSALNEVGPGIDGLRRRYDAEAASRMLDDPSLVRVMDDHGLLYGHPDAAARLDFLPSEGPRHALSELAGGWEWPRHDDLTDDLAELVGRYLGSGLDVVAVDTTSPEHRAGDLACAKVIVPGTLPMTFGHPFRRPFLPRLATVPRRLGFRTDDLPEAAINPDPHPFP
jgi:ribosomal protein S12 methylthiotransferase accessory factor